MSHKQAKHGLFFACVTSGERRNRRKRATLGDYSPPRLGESGGIGEIRRFGEIVRGGDSAGGMT